MNRFKYRLCALAYILLATWTQSVLSASCRVVYAPSSDNTLPLLFGGTYGRCVAGCQSRNDPWSDMCRPTNYSRTAACQPSQIRAVIQDVSTSSATALEFSPCQLNKVLRNKTLWIIGDSHMRAFYSSLRCFMLDFWDHKRGECAPLPDKMKLKTLYDAADTQLTNLEGNSPLTDMPKCMHLLDGGRVCWVHSVRGEEIAAPDPKAPGVMQVLQSMLAQPQDIFWISYGRWHYHNCIGFDRSSYITALKQLGQLFQKTRARFPNVFFKVAPHDHTACLGDWAAKRPTATYCLPAGRGNYSLAYGQTLSVKAEEILESFGMPVVKTYDRSLKMPYAHIISPKDYTVDCNHWCTPGLHEWDIWNLYWNIRRLPSTSIRSSSQAPKQSRTKAPDAHQCLAVTQLKPSWWVQSKRRFRNVQY